MTEDVERGAGPVVVKRWRSRLFDRLTLLLAILVVFVSLVGLDYLDLLPAAAGFALVLLMALLIPGAVEIANPSMIGGEASEAIREEAVRLVADALPDPCLILDKRSNVIHRNAPAVQHFPGLMEGNRIAFSMRSPAILSAIEAVRRTGRPQVVELHQTVPNETWYKVAVAQLNDADGILVVTLQSLTDQRRLDSMRTDFIANVSHELRTPLTSLIGFIDTMLGPAAKDEAAKEKFLGIMRNQAGRMSKLIDDLLSLSRIEMRQHVRPTSKVDLGTLLREVNEGLQLQAKEAGVAVNLSFPDGGAQTTGDHDELYEVFENLVENAVKYGGGGGKVDVALSRVDSAAYGWRVLVTDYGVGVEAEHVPRLTERFYRVDAESSRQKKGTGLGLAIVKHIIARHHGALSIKSQPGQGTRVEVLLPA
ncbi:ATP-binding protein [Devosia sp.]|jgi:two-component system phosphate regulon sensor histidine kinase PhoR|uniref:ATP-binding protein n=1 Tax=Devosia sp. TaxID=1871048 RepID=UPI0037C0E954